MPGRRGRGRPPGGLCARTVFWTFFSNPLVSASQAVGPSGAESEAERSTGQEKSAHKSGVFSFANTSAAPDARGGGKKVFSFCGGVGYDAARFRDSGVTFRRTACTRRGRTNRPQQMISDFLPPESREESRGKRPFRNLNQQQPRNDNMDFNELITDFATRHNVDGLSAEDGVAALDVDGIIVHIVAAGDLLAASAEIGEPPAEGGRHLRRSPVGGEPGIGGVFRQEPRIGQICRRSPPAVGAPRLRLVRHPPRRPRQLRRNLAQAPRRLPSRRQGRRPGKRRHPRFRNRRLHAGLISPGPGAFVPPDAAAPHTSHNQRKGAEK